MSRILGRTKQEVQALSIARALISAIERMEYYDGDPDDILERCQEMAQGTKGIKETIEALRRHYKHEDQV